MQGGLFMSGEVRTAILPQDVPDDLPGTVYDVVASGGEEHADLLREYHELTLQIGRSSDDGLIRKLERVQHQIETSGAWHFHQRVETVIARTELDENALLPVVVSGVEAAGLSGKGPGERSGPSAAGRAHQPP